MKNKSHKVLKAWVKPSLFDLSIGILFQHGIFTVEQKKIGNKILLTAEIPEGDKSILTSLRKAKALDHRKALFEKIKIESIKNQKWVDNYKKNLKSFPFVFPSLKKKKDSQSALLWIDPRGKIPKIVSANTLYIEAGLAFGTGTHPTTQQCAQLLAEQSLIHPKASVLDLGCGTGLLAMVASKLGAHKVWAVDNDPVALEVAQENLTKNKIKNIQLNDDLRKCPKDFEIIVANILLVTLLELKNEIVKRVKRKGALILSGLLYKDCAEIIKAYQKAGLILKERRNHKGWSALLFQKN